MVAWYKEVSKVLGNFCKGSKKPCQDKSKIICENKELYGGCTGSAKKYFEAYCRKSCDYC